VSRRGRCCDACDLDQTEAVRYGGECIQSEPNRTTGSTNLPDGKVVSAMNAGCGCEVMHATVRNEEGEGR